MKTTLYRCIASAKLPDWTHTSTFPVSREDFLSGIVPVDEFFVGEDRPLTKVRIDAACKRAARQVEAMRRIDAEFEYQQEKAA